jgi:L-threonylcarbamoyladenylate synthase
MSTSVPIHQQPDGPGVSTIAVDPVRPDTVVVAQAGAALRDGALVAFPTETVYGLGAALGRPDAIARVFEAKGRPATDPLIVHLPEADALDGVVASFPPDASALADAFWPGPLTLVLHRGPQVRADVTAGGPAVAVRVPAHPVALALLRAAAVPVAAPSANRFGRISPTCAADVAVELGDRLLAGRDLLIDGGPTPLGIESTVVDLTADRPRVLRHGGVPWEDLVAVVGPVDGAERRVVPDDVAAPAPGGLLGHYAPATPLVLVEGDELTLDELVAALGAVPVRAAALRLAAEPAAAARSLYRLLRDADGSADVLLVTPLRPDGLGRAVNDRLFRAAHGRVVAGADQRVVDRIVAAARA